MLTDFQNSFTFRLTRKFVTKSYLNTPPHPKCVVSLVTLPCEISMFKNRSAQEEVKQTVMQDLALYALKRCFKINVWRN